VEYSRQNSEAYERVVDWFRRGVIVDPSFFFSETRFDDLIELCKKTAPETVILPTAVYLILRARLEKGERVRDLTTEDYFVDLRRLVLAWEGRHKEMETLAWISGSMFWENLDWFLRSLNVSPVSVWVDKFGSNPIDFEATRVLPNRITRRTFYDLLAASEKLGRPIVAATGAFARFCRRARIATFEDYPKWKDELCEKGSLGGLIIILAGVVGEEITRLIPVVGEFLGPVVMCIIWDGPRPLLRKPVF